MASLAETVMGAILARLQGSPALCDNVRRAHRVPVTLENSPAIYLIDGDDVPTPSRSDCRTDRTKSLTIAVIVRSDSGASAADALVCAVNDLMNPDSALPGNAVMRQGAIHPNEEVADTDAVQIDMEFQFDYRTSGWALDA